MTDLRIIHIEHFPRRWHHIADRAGDQSTMAMSTPTGVVIRETAAPSCCGQGAPSIALVEIRGVTLMRGPEVVTEKIDDEHDNTVIELHTRTVELVALGDVGKRLDDGWERL